MVHKAIEKNVKLVSDTDKINTRIFYKNRKLKSLFIKNKRYQQPDSHVVYQYLCPKDECNFVKYVGYTTCSLSKRFYTHVQSGSIRAHNNIKHNSKPLTKELIKSTTILYRSQNKTDLTIAEAILIKQMHPALNLQDELFARTLQIF